MVFSFFWTKSAIAQQVTTRKQALHAAEARLIALSHHFGGPSSSTGEAAAADFDVSLHDTEIPRSSVPLASHETDLAFPDNEKQQANNNNDSTYTIHSIHIESKNKKSMPPRDNTHTDDAPLVLLHGYMNGASYFYRNWGGLSRYFSNIHALDWLGYGLSSRPAWKLPATTPLLKDADNHGVHDDDDDDDKTGARAAEHVFVESLEAWRQQNGIEKMILAGHSMGGYISVAYTERYPEHVERLILLSPVGVPEETEQVRQERLARRQNLPLHWRMLWRFMEHVFQRYSLGDVLRFIPENKSLDFAQRYVTARLPSIQDPTEQEAISEYLYYNSIMPGSAEYAVHNFLKPSILAHQPQIHRIPFLQVPSIAFVYGKNDWMDIAAGLQVQQLVSAQRRHDHSSSSCKTLSKVQVLQVPNAGHLLMLDNPNAFNEAVAMAAGKLETTTTTTLVQPPLSPRSSTAAMNLAKLEAAVAAERAAKVVEKTKLKEGAKATAAQGSIDVGTT